MKRGVAIAGIAVLWGWMMGVRAQLPLKISAHIQQPLPPQWVAWQQNPDLILINVFNTSSSDIRDAELRFAVYYGGRRILATKRQGVRLPRFTFPAQEVVTLRADEAGFTAPMLEYDEGMLRDAVRSGCLPAGSYQLCIEIFNSNGVRVGVTDPCIAFSIQWPTPPVAVYPLEGHRYAPGALPRFHWRPVYNAPQGMAVRYRLRVAPLRKGLTPREAIESVPLLDRLVETPYYQYDPSDPALDENTTYVWRVEAVGGKGEPLQTCGSRLSGTEIRTFGFLPTAPPDTVGGGRRIRLYAHWPADGDTIPWRHPLLTVRFAPYSDQLRGVDFTVEVEGVGADNSVFLVNHRTLRWPDGPIAGQGLAPGDTDRAVIHILNQIDDAGVPLDWTHQLRRGRSYRWRAVARFRWADGRESRTTTPWQTFTLGMKRPVRRFPPEEAAYPVGAEVPLQWHTPRPAALQFEPVDLVSVRGGRSLMSFPWARERVELVVADHPEFKRTIFQKEFQLPATDVYRLGDACEGFFTSREVRFRGTDSPGTYYWRVHYLDDGGLPYAVGPTWRFEVREERRDSVSADECMVVQAVAPVGLERRALPSFSAQVQPLIRLEGLRGGILQVWNVDSLPSDPAATIRRPPSRTFRLGGASDFLIEPYGTYSQQLIIQSINRDGAAHRFEAEPGKSYVWRLILYVDAARVRQDGVVCNTDSVVMPPATFTYLPFPEHCEGCADAAPPSDRTPSPRRIRRGDTLKVGRYRMVLTSVRGRPDNLRGEGVIPVRFFRGLPPVPIAVEFDGIQVNGAKELYGGTVYAKVSDVPWKDRLQALLETGSELAADEVRAVHSWIDADPLRRLSDRLATAAPLSLPLGVDEELEGRRFTVGIVGLRFTPQRAELAATVWVEVPELFRDGQGLGFSMGGVCLLPDAGIASPQWIVGLAGDVGIGAFTFKGWRGGTDSGTYVEMYCGGLRVIQLEVEEAIGRNVLIPLGSDGRPIEDPNRRVKLTYTLRWEAARRGTGSGTVVQGTLDEAALAAAPEYKLRGRGGIQVFIDRSAVHNPRGLALPMPGGARETAPPSWMGVYVPQAALELPPLWASSRGEPTRLEVRDLLIDTSISFTLEGTNVVDRLALAQWGGSLDTVRIVMIQGSFVEAVMKGRLSMPVSDSALHYQALYADASADSMVFSVDPQGALNFPITDIGRLQLDPSSTIHVEAVGGQVRRLDAYLNGELTVAGSVGDIPGIDLRGVRFERFGWVTEVRKAPDGTQSYTHRFNRGTWSLASPQHSVGGFSVALERVDVVGPHLRGSHLGVGLQLTLDAQLVENSGDAGTGISGRTALSFQGEVAMDAAAGRLRPQFNGVYLDTIWLSAELGAARLDGKFWFYSNDPTYGNGFRGEVTAAIMELAEGEAVAQFGSVEGPGGRPFHYWYVDAALRVPSGISAGPVAFYGFGGGAWYRMRVEPKASCREASTTRVAGPNPGASASCYRFVPDENGSFGVKALTTLGLPTDPRTFNSDLELSAAFNGRTGGLERAEFNGDMWIAAGGSTPFEGLTVRGRRKAPVWGEARLTFTYTGTDDGRAPVFDGTFTAHLAMPRSECILCGDGTVFMHFGPDDWFIWVGRPWSSGTPVNVSVHLGGLRLGGVASYLQVGSRLDPQPPLPAEVIEITGGRAAHPMRMTTLLQHGGGFAFGQQLDFNTGRLEFLMFYGRLRLLTGYDVTLRRVAGGVECTGVRPPIGMNGWYATGQLYAYAAAQLGMHVDVWFYEGDVEILDCEAGAFLQAGMPNPTWMKGAVGGRFSALGGLVEGNVNFRFTVGTECRPPVEGPLSMPLIADMQPSDGDRGVDVMVAPQAAFTFPVGEPFEIEEYREGSDEPIIRRFRVMVEDAYLEADDGTRPLGRWHQESAEVGYFEPHDMLRGHARYWWVVRVRGEEYDFAAGRWRAARERGRPVIQERRTEFTTGAAPQTIPAANIAAMYPQAGQRYVLAGEVSEGFIQLRRGMPDLLNNPDRQVKVRWVATGGEERIVPARYEASRRRLVFPLTGLEPGRTYLLEVLSVARRSLADIAMPQVDIPNPEVQRRLEVIREQVAEGQAVYWQRKTLPHQRRRTGERRLYHHYFATSRYATLDEKINALFGDAEGRLLCGPRQCLMVEVTVTDPPEWFDEYDISWRLWGGGGKFGERGLIATAVARRGPWARMVGRRIYRYIEAEPWRTLLGWRGQPSSIFSAHALMVSEVDRPLAMWEIRRAFGVTDAPAMAALGATGHLGTALPGGGWTSPAAPHLAASPPTRRLTSLCLFEAALDQASLRRRIAQALREDAFIRSFERMTGHAWHPANRPLTMTIAGLQTTGVADHLGHFHSWDELGIPAGHFPRMLQRPLTRTQRRQLASALRQLSEPVTAPEAVRRLAFKFRYNPATTSTPPAVLEINTAP